MQTSNSHELNKTRSFNRAQADFEGEITLSELRPILFVVQAKGDINKQYFIQEKQTTQCTKMNIGTHLKQVELC